MIATVSDGGIEHLTGGVAVVHNMIRIVIVAVAVIGVVVIGNPFTVKSTFPRHGRLPGSTSRLWC